MHEQQLINYLYWLKDRGQVFVSPSLEAVEDVQPVEVPLLPIKLLFVSDQTLIPAEFEMVGRIGSALGLTAQDFQVIEEAALSGFNPNFVVAMGDLAVSLPNALVIPHPRDMLKNPQLKVSAWEKLQRLKGQIS